MLMIGDTPKIRLPYPHNGQQTVRREARRFNWLSAGRRWRKTTLAMAIAVEGAIEGQRIIWGAPTFDQVRIGWNETRQAAGGVFEFTIQRMMAEYPQSGGAIIYRSLDDPDNARGHTADGVVIDEIGDVKQAAWYEVMRPMLIDTGGWMWGIGTPKGRNWFWKEHRAALDREDSMCWQVPTKGCEIVDGKLVRKSHPLENPDIMFMEIEQLYATTPLDIFKQEILAEFIEGEGQVFRNIGACMGAPLAPQYIRDHNRHKVVVGVDWGKQQDFTAISVGCADCKEELARDRFNKIDYIFQRERLKALIEPWHPAIVKVELNAIGIPNFEQLQRDGLPVVGFETTASSKPPLIENLALVFERGEWQFQADEIWTAELEAYERKVSPVTGRSSYSAPDGLHDDTVIARALMVQAGQMTPLPKMQPANKSKWSKHDASEGSRWKKY